MTFEQFCEAHPWAVVRDSTGEVVARFTNWRLARETAVIRSGKPTSAWIDGESVTVGEGVEHHVVGPDGRKYERWMAA
jgi:hypothetical protein